MNSQELLDRFLIAKEAAGLASRSLHWYSAQNLAYLEWLEVNPGFGFTAPESVEMFLAHERRRGLAPSTIHARYRGLSAWFGWLTKRNLIPANPIAAVDRPRIPKKHQRYVPLRDFLALYTSIQDETWLDERDRAIMLLLLFSGLRVSEVIGLHVDDVDLDERMVHVRAGKGGHSRDVPVAPDFKGVHIRYLLSRPAYPGTELFVSHDGYRGVRGVFSANGVRQMLRRRCRAAGLPEYNPHAFRHGFAMLFLNAGMALSAVSEAMGHTSEQTTRIYARYLKDGLSRAYESTVRQFVIPGENRR